MSVDIENGRITLVEDDQKLGDQIQRYLQKNGYHVQRVINGLEAITQINNQPPDTVILDLMLPGADGFQVCREIRSGFSGDILILTASEDDMDHVAGLELGADGYLIKPIHPRVLLAHLRLLERKREPTLLDNSLSEDTEMNSVSDLHIERTQSNNSKYLTFGGLNIHPIQRSVTLNGVNITLTPAEFDVLLLLVNHPEEIISRDEILQTLRGIEYDGFDRSVDVKISALRKKLQDNTSQPQKIITVRAKGYLFVPDAWS